MAVTSIWSVKGWLGKVMIYVENPEKTENPKFFQMQEAASRETQSLSDVIAYAVNEEKTRQKEGAGTWNQEKPLADEGEEVMQQYVSGINCAPATARSEMMAVKKRYGKDEGIMAFHGYQSFAPGECTPAMAHEIGVKLAEELWGGRFQVLVATHLDKAHHLHNHFVVNSVSFADGLRYHRTNQDYRDMRKASDRLCREYGLSVVERLRSAGSKHYGEWRAEQEGRPTYRGMVRADIEEAIANARTEKQFFQYLKEKGYSFKIGKDITVCPAGRERGLKLARNFGEEYTIESIHRRILTQSRERQDAYEMLDNVNVPDWVAVPDTQAISARPAISSKFAVTVPKDGRKKLYIIKLHGSYKNTRKIGGLRGLYVRYCYLLGILPKDRVSVSTKQMHFLLREDLTKLNRISKETRLLCHYRIDTAEQLFAFREDLQNQMRELSDTRKHLRYRCRSIREEGKQAEIKEEISGLTEQIGRLRKEVVLCDGIAARSGVIKEKIEVMRQENKQEKEEKSHEHIRRSR